MKHFNFSTVEDFDNHISSSICGYDLLHDLIINISSFFINENDKRSIVDLGCTTGKLLRRLGTIYKCKRIGFDIQGDQFVEGEDLRIADITTNDFVIPDSQLIYSIFTLQFIDVGERLAVLKKVYNALSSSGALIFCEKEYCDNSKNQEIFTFSNYDNKAKGFSSDDILNKERAIRAIMTPLSSSENIGLLKDAGFKHIEIFFKSLNFTGYLCRK